ncbi:hypothetical protein K491DRAFT_601627 [Lophiostoma macrostomum CBS 122681]|uniref:Uncharacterized protein n=1 Tax=Lophiostoma macrostomum CBS 122681 TaxID=1314788 RepID=A0A6A6T424_9PLEO|nr:hypothetical protein K491DRAFT_601627 [Lophiostoma macrostomum CBS 122681]
MTISRAETLSGYFSKAKGDLEPIVTNLNGDNSWMISFPIPSAKRQRKAYYHVVSDAWLQGIATQISSWLVTLGLPETAAVTNGSEVDQLVQEIEDAARKANIVDGQGPATLDAIFSNFHYIDHLSEATLRTFACDIPVIASPEAAKIARGWSYFDTIITTKDLDPAAKGWKALHPGASLPEWLNVFRLQGHHELNFATAMVWSSGPDLEKHQALLYSPHGIRAEQPTLQTFAHKLDPPLNVAAIMHALHDSFGMGARYTTGVAGGLALERETKSKYWIQSHDAQLVYGGWFMRLFVRDIPRTLESGIEELLGKKGKEYTEEDARKPNLVTVGNGSCFVLE